MGGLHHSAHNGGHSSRQEMRSEQQYVNGQPVYDLYHKRRYEDGRVVDDYRVEKDEDELRSRPVSHGAYSRQSSLTRSSSSSRNSYDRGGYHHPSSLGSPRGHTRTYGSGDYSSLHEQSESSDTFDRDFARMQENLRRQMISYGQQQPSYGGSQRNEYSSHVRYVNGKPVYERKEERTYKDGQLVHNDTHEKGPEHFGTEDVIRRYDANGVLITDGSYGGDTHFQRWETRGQSSSPSSRPTYTSGYSSFSQEEQRSGTTYPSHRLPTDSSSTRYSQTYESRYPSQTPISRPYKPTYNRVSSEHRNTELHTSSSSSPYASRTPGSTRPAHRDFRGSSYDYDSREDIRSSYTPGHSYYPSQRRPSTPNREYSPPHHRPVSGESSLYYRQQTRQSSSDSDLTQQRPANPSDNLQVTHVQQASRNPEDEQPSSQHVQHTAHSSLTWESSRDHSQQPYVGVSGLDSTDRDAHYRGYMQRERVPGSDYPYRRPSPGGRHPDTIEEEDESEEDLQQQVDTEDDRYDISPLDDSVLPPVPPVDNEMVFSGRTPDSPSHHTSSSHHARPGYSQTTFHEDKTRTTSNTRPMSEASRHYQYNETRRHTSVASGDQQPYPEGLPCTRANGCVVVDAPHTSSRRSEIRTVYRYVNGLLVGMTQHERQYENGEMVYDNTTEHGRDEVAHLNLEEYGVGQLDLPQEAIRPGIYSQQHEIKEEKKYVNGQQIYDLRHERHFEDGSLVYNKRIELDEDDLQNTGNAGAGRQVIDQSREDTIQSPHHPIAGGVDTSFLHQVRCSSYVPIPSHNLRSRCT